MITIFQAIFLGLLQGVTELFPISSLGHSAVLPKLVGWNIHQNDPYFLTFLVATHLATALVLFGFFWRDWLKIFQGLIHSIKSRRIDTVYAKLGWLLIVGTIPAGILGLLFEKSIRGLFDSAQLIAAFLILNGFILLLAEKLRKSRIQASSGAAASDKNIAKLKWYQSAVIGTAQAAALLPGISRSGSSMGGGLLAGLNNEDAARFSFLLATPIIGAAAVLKLPGIFDASYDSMRTAMLVGALCAALAAFLSVKFLVNYFQTNTLKPFAIYCLVVGALLSGYFIIK